ncbi:MAG: hypothetical protein NTY09_07455 [bacterium]|nr:hypothetical protein [bacterium]
MKRRPDNFHGRLIIHLRSYLDASCDVSRLMNFMAVSDHVN